LSEKLSKPKRKGGPLRIPTADEEVKIISKRDLVGLLPVINIALSIIFILLIPNFFIDVLLLFMLVLTIAFFLSVIVSLWQQKQDDHTENYLLIFNSSDVSPLVLYAGQFIYGYFFLSFIFLGFIEAISVLSIFIWIYFVFSTLFLVMIIWAIIEFVKEAGKKKKELKKNIMKELNKHEKTENYAAQSYYLQLLIKVIETPLIKAKFLSILITATTILLTIVPFIIPV
jgi:membrane protein implicated in regulation of membrane protease activity